MFLKMKNNIFNIYLDLSVLNAKQGFRYVSVSKEPGQVWAISGAGIVCRRIGINEENPAGTGWSTGIGVSHINYILKL